jgi:hypothetical protein
MEKNFIIMNETICHEVKNFHKYFLEQKRGEELIKKFFGFYLNFLYYSRRSVLKNMKFLYYCLPLYNIINWLKIELISE